jgi:hypothetical protein
LEGVPEVAVCQRVQDDIATGCGEREDALGGGDDLVICTHEVEMV